MRITPKCSAIAWMVFAPVRCALVRVFGSRVDDSKRGGDIDLLLTTSLSNTDAIVRTEIAFPVRIQRALGEQRIDVPVDYPGRRVRPPIFDIAERTGVRL
jgi:hypothetical protein